LSSEEATRLTKTHQVAARGEINGSSARGGAELRAKAKSGMREEGSAGPGYTKKREVGRGRLDLGVQACRPKRGGELESQLLMAGGRR